MSDVNALMDQSNSTVVGYGSRVGEAHTAMRQHGEELARGYSDVANAADASLMSVKTLTGHTQGLEQKLAPLITGVSTTLKSSSNSLTQLESQLRTAAQDEVAGIQSLHKQVTSAGVEIHQKTTDAVNGLTVAEKLLTDYEAELSGLHRKSLDKLHAFEIAASHMRQAMQAQFKTVDESLDRYDTDVHQKMDALDEAYTALISRVQDHISHLIASLDGTSGTAFSEIDRHFTEEAIPQIRAGVEMLASVLGQLNNAGEGGFQILDGNISGLLNTMGTIGHLFDEIKPVVEAVEDIA